MAAEFIVTTIQSATVAEFCLVSLMDPLVLESLGQQLYQLVDEQDRRTLVLDFTRVQYLSSQAIGIVMNLHRKLNGLNGGQLILCGVGPRLQELLHITRLDKVLAVKASQKEVIKSLG